MENFPKVVPNVCIIHISFIVILREGGYSISKHFMASQTAVPSLQSIRIYILLKTNLGMVRTARFQKLWRRKLSELS